MRGFPFIPRKLHAKCQLKSLNLRFCHQLADPFGYKRTFINLTLYHTFNNMSHPQYARFYTSLYALSSPILVSITRRSRVLNAILVARIHHVVHHEVALQYIDNDIVPAQDSVALVSGSGPAPASFQILASLTRCIFFTRQAKRWYIDMECCVDATYS